VSRGQAEASAAWHGEHDPEAHAAPARDTAVLAFQAAHGCGATVEVSWSCGVPRDRVEILVCGDRGALRLSTAFGFTPDRDALCGDAITVAQQHGEWHGVGISHEPRYAEYDTQLVEMIAVIRGDGATPQERGPIVDSTRSSPGRPRTGDSVSAEHRRITFGPTRPEPTFTHDTFPDWPQATPAALAALIEIFRSGHWWQSGGGACERFETWLASRHGVDHAIGVANGTVALEIALRAVGVCAGDDVLVPALTFISTASAVSAVGARPIPVDVERGSLCLSIDDAMQKRTERTTAVIAVHLAGQPAHMPRARRFASAHGLALIEDAAQAICAEWMGTPVGGFATQQRSASTPPSY
jgi:hypothetical protein